MDIATTEEALWLDLANLFFLDTEPDERDFLIMAEKVRQAGWTRAQTAAILTTLIAPVAGPNLGYLLFPVIGEWAGFDAETIIPRVRSLKARRETRPHWHFMLQDWNSRRMLRLLEMDRLLRLIPD